MTPIEKALDVVRSQRAMGFPEDQILIPPDLACEVLAWSGPYSCIAPEALWDGEIILFGARVGRPCGYCGRRKRNKGAKTCDGCAAPLREGPGQ